MQRNSGQQLEIQARQMRVAEAYLRGTRSQTELAAMLGIAQTTISRDLKAIKLQWRSNAVEYYSQATEEELAKLERVERAAWQAFEESRGTHEKKHAGLKVTPDGEHKITSVVKEDFAGDAKFLDIALRCHERRCKLLGLDAPQRHEFIGGLLHRHEHTASTVDERRAAALALIDTLSQRVGAANDPDVVDGECVEPDGIDLPAQADEPASDLPGAGPA